MLKGKPCTGDSMSVEKNDINDQCYAMLTLCFTIFFCVL